MEFNDVYNENRERTGKIIRRGEAFGPGEYGFAVCVWVYDGKGNVLLTRRAPGKSFAGTWENSGGAALSGEDSLTAIQRELWEETGIRAEKEEFEYLSTSWGKQFFFDHYCLKRQTPIDEVVLLPGETDGVMWATFDQVHEMIRTGQICTIIGEQFLHEEPELKKRQTAQELA